MKQKVLNTNGLKVVFDRNNTYGLTEVSLNTDLLIAKENKEKRFHYDVIAMSMYGTSLDIGRVFKKKSVSDFRIRSRRNHHQKFRISKGEEYDTEETKKGYTRLTIIKRKNLMLDETKETTPFIIIPKEEENDLEKIVFEHVRDSIISPLFPNLEDPSKLSKELFTTVDEAKKILDRVNAQDLRGFNERAAYDGINRYREWTQFLYNQMKNDNRIDQLKVFAFNEEDVIAIELAIDEEAIKSYITKGLRNGDISFSNQKNYWNRYGKFDEYMGRYANILKKVIESQSEPIHRKGDIRKDTKKEIEDLGRLAIPAQIDTIEAMVKSIDHQNKVNVVGEPGVGKTFMMLTAAYLESKYSKKPMKALVLSPGHLVKTAWEAEVKETFEKVGKNVKIHHIKNVNNLIKFENKGYLDDEIDRVFILGQNNAKSGYSNRPAVIWNKDRRVFQCPDCFGTVEQRIVNKDATPLNNLPKMIDVPVPFSHFATERHNNRKCKHCNSVLWRVNNKKALSGFKESIIGEKEKDSYVYCKIGFLPNDPKHLRREIEKAVITHNDRKNRNTKGYLENLREAELVLEGHKKERNQISPYKVPISFYIKKKLKHRFSHLIIDELHEYQSTGSSRTASASDLVASIKKIITGTGTMMNGYAKSRFYNDFMLFPGKMKKAGFNIDDMEKYQVDFGVTEKRFRVAHNGKRTSLSPKSKPGISPMIFPMFLQDSTVFISMKDLENSMPKLKHRPIGVQMTDELRKGKEELEKYVRRVSKKDKKLFKGLMPTLYAYLDMPTVKREVKDAEENVIYTTKELDNHNDNKTDALKKIARDEKLQGRRTIVYTHYTGDGINNHIQERLQEDGFMVTVLNKEGEPSISCDGSEINVKKDDREKFVKEEVNKGTDILIVNPILVQTGTNLIDFHSIVYFQMSYQVYTIRQADRRTWRIGQTEDCTIYYLYYENSFQENIASLMATKIVASESIEGNMNQQGLEAITNDRTPEEELAKKFFDHMNI